MDNFQNWQRIFTFLKKPKTQKPTLLSNVWSVCSSLWADEVGRVGTWLIQKVTPDMI